MRRILLPRLPFKPPGHPGPVPSETQATTATIGHTADRGTSCPASQQSPVRFVIEFAALPLLGVLFIGLLFFPESDPGRPFSPPPGICREIGQYRVPHTFPK